jgi:uncharacterized protein (UPF0297 family)
MKVFFAANYTDEKKYQELYTKIYHTLEELGCTHVDDEVITMNDATFVKQMQQGREAYIEYYKRKMNAIQKADICIFEGTVPTLALGYITQKALDYNKPTIVLYFEQDSIPYLLSGADDDKLVIKNYTDKNIKKILKEVLNTAKERRDKRFNFFISPRLLTYLDKVSKEQGITKSTFIRNLIVDHIRKSTQDPKI